MLCMCGMVTVRLSHSNDVCKELVRLNSIRRRRVECGLSQVALAKKLDVKQAAVSQWESGRYVPDYVNLKKLAEIFGCEPNDVLCSDAGR